MTKTGTRTGDACVAPTGHRGPKRILSRLGSRLDRRFNLSVLLQLMVLASMILA